MARAEPRGQLDDVDRLEPEGDVLGVGEQPLDVACSRDPELDEPGSSSEVVIPFRGGSQSGQRRYGASELVGEDAEPLGDRVRVPHVRATRASARAAVVRSAGSGSSV